MTNIAYEDVVQFHGHSCPGVAIGYRMTLAGLAALEEVRAEDEELVAIIENDACGVDALQYISGCTFGKGNLIFRDYGKSTYTIFSRSTGQGVRITCCDDAVPARFRDDRAARIDWILTAPEDMLLRVQMVTIDEPPKARIHESIPCDACGERVMSTRIQHSGQRKLCIPCWEREQQAGVRGATDHR